MFDRNDLSFRRLTTEDLLLLYQWLRNPVVARWWGPVPDDIAAIEEKYGPRVDEREGVESYIMSMRETPVGFIQTYRLSVDPEYQAAVQEDPDAAAVDLFIGEDRFRFRGFGPFALRQFVERIVFDGATVPYCVIVPSVSNAAAIRAYEKAGFRHVRTVDVPGEDEPEYVMVMQRDEDSKT